MVVNSGYCRVVLIIGDVALSLFSLFSLNRINEYFFNIYTPIYFALQNVF